MVCAIRNYLRVRGEYVNKAKAFQSWKELPPRARRIHGMWLVAYYVGGTTSACAENTKGHRIKPFTGEELPPRARRIPSCGDD